MTILEGFLWAIAIGLLFGLLTGLGAYVYHFVRRFL